jgi:hypothetical protein
MYFMFCVRICIYVLSLYVYEICGVAAPISHLTKAKNKIDVLSTSSIVLLLSVAMSGGRGLLWPRLLVRGPVRCARGVLLVVWDLGVTSEK